MEKEEKPDLSFTPTDQVEQAMATIAERSQRIVSAFLARQARDRNVADTFDPLHIGDAFLQMTAQMLASPVTLVEAQISMWSDYMQLWQNTAQRLLGGEPDEDASTDKNAAEKMGRWRDEDIFDFVKQSYLLTARWIQTMLKTVEGLDDDQLHKIDFYTRQFADAMNSVSFFADNPDLLRVTVDSRGENLVKGLDHLLGDLERGKGRLAISGRNLKGFKLGENVAATPGKVVMRNDLAELLHYRPTRAKTHKVPLLILPPWGHKYYLLDLRPSNSLVKWALDRGHDVFMLSWSEGRTKEGLESAAAISDYLRHGVLAALDRIFELTGEDKVNGLGFALGGTLLAATLGYLAAKGENRFNSATYLASLLDFSEVGEISVFIDEEQLQGLDRINGHKPDRQAASFNMLRANDLIWSFVIDNYRLEHAPFPFDLLYWNADTPRPPTALQRFYLQELYQRNLLAKPGGLCIDGISIDLGKIRTPSYVLALDQDHISPWKSVFAATALLGGPARFVRAAGGHIGGIVNPPDLERHGYVTKDRIVKDPDAWLSSASRHDGSWWPDWGRWLEKRAGPLTAARQPDAKAALGAAPGRYVKA